MDDAERLKLYELKLLETAVTAEAAHHGNIDERAALRLIRANIGPVVERMEHERWLVKLGKRS